MPRLYETVVNQRTGVLVGTLAVQLGDLGLIPLSKLSPNK